MKNGTSTYQFGQVNQTDPKRNLEYRWFKICCKSVVWAIETQKKKEIKIKGKIAANLGVKELHAFSDKLQNNWAAKVRLILKFAF